MNESVIRSPKWLRNVVDFEINTGEDIKGKPSKKNQQKIDDELKRKKQEKEQQDTEEAERKKKEKEELFDKLFNTIIAWTTANYKQCEISGYSERIRIKMDNLVYEKVNMFSFDLTLINDAIKPKFDVTINYNDIKFSYSAGGFVSTYTDFKLFILKTIFPWYLFENAKKRSQDHNKQKYDKYKEGGYKNEPEDDSGFDDRFNDYYNKKSSTNTKSKPSDNESEEKKNKRRRYELLKTTLEGHKRHLKRIEDWEKLHAGKKHEERSALENEISVTKDKINLMNKQFQFESVYYYKHLKPIFS
jgi:hypothetical protein